jgi:hypothetical protein
MIRPDFDWVRVAFQIMSEVFQGKDDCKEFFVVNFIVVFSRLQGL